MDEESREERERQIAMAARTGAVGIHLKINVVQDALRAVIGLIGRGRRRRRNAGARVRASSGNEGEPQ